LPTRREDLLARLAEPAVYDLAVVGGGATGLGVALDAALSGYRVLLVESHDFAGGTSSRSTKLVHGGVRYLAQGRLGLVREALHERACLLRNAPHLAQPLPFVLPVHSRWERALYGLGLRGYDALAGSTGLGRTVCLDRDQTLQALPGLRAEGLAGGVQYWDGQFDDARLALALARTAAAQGALLLNYCAVVGLRHEDGRVAGLLCEDRETGRRYPVAARCVVNAAGVWVDALRHQDGVATGETLGPLVAPSQGVHLVVDADFLPGGQALLVPHTADGRVLFAVPWLGKLILGTTDTPRADLPREPRPLASEVDLILGEAGRWLARAPTRADVRSAWVGLRPLVRPEAGVPGSSAALGREHAVRVSRSGLVTVTGGKWTTYRAMAADVLAQCRRAGLLAPRPAAPTDHFPLVGAPPAGTASLSLSAPPGWHLYGAEAAAVQALPGAGQALAPGLSEAMVRFAVRHEYARTVEDVLARRSRLLFLDATLATALAPAVAALVAEETRREPALAAFVSLACQYQALPGGIVPHPPQSA